MLRILFLAATPDDGSAYAARNIEEALRSLEAGEICCEVLPPLTVDPGLFSAFAPRDEKFLQTLLLDAISRRQPDVLVFNSPVYSRALDAIYATGRTRDFLSLYWISDADGDLAWSRDAADYAIVSPALAGEVEAKGVPAAKLKCIGFPVQPSSHHRLERKAPANRHRRILYLGNCLRKKTARLLGRLLEHEDWEVTFSAEGDSALVEVAEECRSQAGGRLTILRETGELPDLLRSHDVVISRATTALVQEAAATRTPMLLPKAVSLAEKANLKLVLEANGGVPAPKPGVICAWLERAFRDDLDLLDLWRANLAKLAGEDGAAQWARLILTESSRNENGAPARLHALPPPEFLPVEIADSGHPVPFPARRTAARDLLMCDLHTHTTWSDGKMTVRELVDFYGERRFDCLCITDHLCDPRRLLGQLVNLTGLVILPGREADYFAAIDLEKKRAWSKYDMILMTGIEFNKDGYTPKTSAHLLGIDLKKPVNPSLSIEETIFEIHAQGGLAIASHPHETKGTWGKNTLFFWDNIEKFAPLLDAWEIANRDDIFNPVGLKKLPFIASSDLHKPKHIHSWKTLLYCEKDAEAIKQCIRVNRDVSLTLYRDRRFGVDDAALPGLQEKDVVVRSPRLEPVQALP